MKFELLVVVLPILLIGVLLQFTPLLTRRGIFFSATVDPQFPGTDAGRRLLRSYRLQVGILTGIAVALFFVLFPEHLVSMVFAPMLVLIIGSGLCYWLKFREIHERFGRSLPEIRAADLSRSAARERFSFWLSLPPFFAIAAVAAYLGLHWAQLPQQFPVHWDINGQPNGWAFRDWKGVYGPLIACTLMNAFLLGIGWFFARQARRTVMRSVTVRMTQLLLYPLTFMFLLVALLPVLTVPMWLGPVVMAVSIAAIIYWSYRQISAPAAADAVPDPQSDSYWKAGVFYYNPTDPAIFVAKRVGIGYTINFGNKVSWLVMAGILLIAILPAILLHAK